MNLELSKSYLDNIILEVQRTRWLYVDVAGRRGELPEKLRGDLPLEHSLGYFEPIRLFFCWADLLGALHSGDGSQGNPRRVKAWLGFMGGAIRKEYGDLAEQIYATYRNALIHAGFPR